MPKKQHNEVLVGVFVSAGAVLLLLLLFLMGTLDRLFSASATVHVEFSDVQGLQEGDPVWLFGVNVGKVTSLETIPRQEGKRAVVRVGLRLPAASMAYLRTDSVVKIDKQLTGRISVLIQESDGPPLPEGTVLTGTPTVDLATVTQKANVAMEEARTIISSLSRMVKDVEDRGEVTKALAEARSLLEQLNQRAVPLTEKLKQALEDVHGILEENRLDLRHAVANLRETSSAAKSFTEKLALTPEQLSRSLAELERAGGAVHGLLSENRASVDTIVADLRQTLTNTSNLTSEVKRRPWRLLYRPTESELKAMDLYDAAWAYNLGATELNRSIRDLTTRLEVDPQGAKNPELLEEARRQLAQSLRKHREAEDRFWERLKSAE